MEVFVLGPADVDRMTSLLTVFGRAFDDPNSYASNQPSEQYLAELLGNSHFIAIAAVMDDRVVGGLTGYVLPKFEQARKEIYLYDLAVDEPYRRQGVATALIDCLRQEASKRGAWVIFVQADQGDSPAIELYSKLGIREDVLHFDILPLPVRE